MLQLAMQVIPCKALLAPPLVALFIVGTSVLTTGGYVGHGALSAVLFFAVFCTLAALVDLVLIPLAIRCLMQNPGQRTALNMFAVGVAALFSGIVLFMWVMLLFHGTA